MGFVGKGLVASLCVPLLAGGCAGDELVFCSSDADCDGGAVCIAQFCARPERPPPEVVVVADRKGAKVGEAVVVDARASSAPNGETLRFEFRVEPDGGAFVSVDETGARAEVKRRVGHVGVEVIVVAETDSGASAEGRIAIEALNDDPEVKLEALSLPFQPGAQVALRAPASDADGDALTWEWQLHGGVGSITGEGESAILETVAGVEEVEYPVSIRVTDGHGGEAQAALTLRPENRPPEIDLEVEPVDHLCAGEPLTCSATFTLEPRAKDAGPVLWSYRLLEERADVAHRFEDLGEGRTRLELACSPACPIAGKFRLEVTARDSLGAEAREQIELEVKNRPPIVRAHDGSLLPHRTDLGEDGMIVIVERPSGAILSWEDPDGDPPDPASIAWSSTLPVVDFTEPGSLETAIYVEGRREDVEAVEILLRAADINGAEAADRTPLPLGNTPPRISFAGDRSEGHMYVRTEVDGTRIYRKRIAWENVEVTDIDGDPIYVDFELELSAGDPQGVARIVSVAGWDYLEGAGPAFLGRDWKVRARVHDGWGGEDSSIGSVRVSNRPPVIVTIPATERIFVGSSCQQHTCCAIYDFDQCRISLPGVVADRWSGGNPQLFTESVIVSDPDGDPVTLDTSFVNTAVLYPRFTLTGGTTASIPCTTGSGGDSSCSVQVRLDGMATNGAYGCQLPSTSVGGSTRVRAVARDGLGSSASREWTYRTRPNESDSSCR